MAGSLPGSAFCLRADIICMTPGSVLPSQATASPVSSSVRRLALGEIAMEDVTSSR